MKITYQNCDCTCCKSKDVCKYVEAMGDLIITSNHDEAPFEIKINCQHFSTDVNYRC